MNQELLPYRNLYILEDEVGRPRHFDTITAVFIGCAAFLLEAGHKRDSVRWIMQAIAEIQPQHTNRLKLPLLANAMMSPADSIVQVADNSCHVAGPSRVGYAIDR